jgi:hypothetical protein
MGPALAIAAVGALVAANPVSAQTKGDAQVTYSKDIAPIMQRSCQNCHRPGSVAPMSLLSYQEVRPFAKEIKRRTQLRYAPYSRGVMPPWFLEENVGIQKMKEDFSLTDQQIATIAKWADNGAPEGSPADLPKALAFADAGKWTLGQPDLIVSSPTFIVPAEASDIGTAIGNTPIGLTEDRYLKSVEFKEVSEYTSKTPPKGAGTIGSLFVIHHANVGIGKADDAGDPTADEDTSVSGDRLPIHEVGRNGDVFPDEAGKLLPANSALIFDNMHIHSSGVPGSERKTRLDVGLRLQPVGYKPKYQLKGAGFGRSELAVMPGQGNQRVDAYFVTTQPMKLWNFEPHMHSTGVRMCIEAIYGRVTETLNCAGYDHNWVRNYIYDENSAPLIPKGSIIHATGWFENTSKNANVLDPRNLSTYGNSSVNNMFIIFNQAVTLTDQQYQEELAKRRAYLALTQDEPIGCPDCYKRPAAPKSAAVPNTVAQR